MRTLILFAACLLSFPVMAGEFAAVGHLQRVTLLPYGASGCPNPCPAGATPGRGVCINLGCGCGRAEITIDHVLVGKPRPRVVVKYQLNEWCDAGFPISNPRVLVNLTDNGKPQWSRLVRLKSGGYAFLAKRFSRIGSVRISSLPAKGGLVPLSELEKRLGL